jgi:class 3 adenylate cyclase
MLFDIVQHMSKWRMDPGSSELQNIEAALKEAGNWGVPGVLEPADIKTMASVNERGLLMFFALFIPALERITDPQKRELENPTGVPAAPNIDTDAVEKLEKAIAKMRSDENTFRRDSAVTQQQVETLSTRMEEYKAEVHTLETNLKGREEITKRMTADYESQKMELREANEKVVQLEREGEALKERIRLQDFDGLEERYKKLIIELSATQVNLASAQQETDRTMRQMRALELKMPMFMRQGKNTVHPPQGEVTLVFTDVEGSTVQWEWDADSMAVAIRVHNDLLRSLLHEHGGYEVKTEGDAFMCAFADPFVAVRWCLDAQEKLLGAKWPEKIFEHDKSKVVVSNATSQVLYKGLRVRMGVHTGRPSNEEDPVTGRMDYFGPMVNRAARVESVAYGGQIVMSSDVYDRVVVQLQSISHIPEIIDLGTFELKGLQDPTRIFQILPVSLTERKFGAVVTKDAELAAEKKKLEDQLQELQEKSQVLAQRLLSLKNEVKSQMSEAEQLLKDLQEARLLGAPPAEMVALLKNQLMRLLEGQSATSRELDIAQVNNEEQLKAAGSAAERREKLAVASVLSEKCNLESQLHIVRATLDQSKKHAQEMEDKHSESNVRVREVEKKAREDRLEVMNLRVLVSELQETLQAGGGGTQITLPEQSSGGNGGSRLLSDSRGPTLRGESVAAKGLERAVKYDQCGSCDLAIREGDLKIEAAGNMYHEGCFACGYCGKLFDGERFFLHNGRPAHDECRSD